MYIYICIYIYIHVYMIITFYLKMSENINKIFNFYKMFINKTFKISLYFDFLNKSSIKIRYL